MRAKPAAAGNDDRSPVSFPASYDLCVAVSALGRIGTFPAGTVEQGEVAKPLAKDKNNFIASFSNIGPELDCTGLGVGIISTVPDAAYAAMDGTSMATPAVTGIAVDQDFPVLLYDDEWSGLRDTLNPEVRTVILNAVDPGIGERPPHIEHQMLDVVEPTNSKTASPRRRWSCGENPDRR